MTIIEKIAAGMLAIGFIAMIAVAAIHDYSEYQAPAIAAGQAEMQAETDRAAQIAALPRCSETNQIVDCRGN